MAAILAYLRPPHRRFAALSFAGVMLLAGGSGGAISSALAGALLDWEVKNAAARAEGLAHVTGLEDLFPGPIDVRSRESLGKEFSRRLALLPDVVRVKLWDRDTTVLWSDESDLVGRRFPQNKTLLQAIGGRVAASLKEPTGPEHLYEAEYASLVEVYVPLRQGRSGEVIGVFEVYVKADALLALIRRLRVTAIVISLLSGLVLYALLLVLARRIYDRPRAVPLTPGP